MRKIQLAEPEHPSKSNKLMIYMAYISLAILAAVVGIFLYWLFQPTDVLEVKNAPVPVRTIRKHTSADGVIILKVDYCKYIKSTGRVRTSFVSASREIFLPIGQDRQEPQCLVTELPILIPHDTPADMYRVKFRVEYRINPITKVIEEFKSKSFEVR